MVVQEHQMPLPDQHFFMLVEVVEEVDQVLPQPHHQVELVEVEWVELVMQQERLEPQILVVAVVMEDLMERDVVHQVEQVVQES
jgi:hypothetical protein